MTELLPVRGMQIGCASCSVERAAGLLRGFLSSDLATEVGISRGYIETVAKALDDRVARQKHMQENDVKNVSKSTSGGLTIDCPGEAEVAGIVGASNRLQKTDVKKTKQKAKALLDFEALLGNEIEKTTYGLDEEHGELGREEKSGAPEMLATSTPGSLGKDHERELKKCKKKKDLQRGMMSGSPARVQDTPGSDRKKKKNHKHNFEDGDIQPESGSWELATEELIREEKVSGVEDSIHKKKIKKRTSAESPGDSNDQPRKAMKSSVSN